MDEGAGLIPSGVELALGDGGLQLDAVFAALEHVEPLVRAVARATARRVERAS